MPVTATGFTLVAMIYPRRQVSLHTRIPTVRVTLATDDGEVSLTARWNQRPIDLQRRILFLIRQGHSIFLEDERGHGICLRPECVWGARVEAPAPVEAATVHTPATAANFSQAASRRRI